MGVQIDGFISLAAHTTIAQAGPTTATPQAVTGRKADVICAAHYAAECAHRLIKPGKKVIYSFEISSTLVENYFQKFETFFSLNIFQLCNLLFN